MIQILIYADKNMVKVDTVKKFVAVAVWRGILKRIDSGRIQQSFVERFNGRVDPVIGDIQREAVESLEQISRNVKLYLEVTKNERDEKRPRFHGHYQLQDPRSIYIDSSSGRPYIFLNHIGHPPFNLNEAIETFDHTWISLLPSGGLAQHIEKATKEMAKKVLDYAQALQEKVKEKPEIHTLTIDAYKFASSFIETLSQKAQETVDKTFDLSVLEKINFQNKLRSNNVFLNEDLDEIPALLEKTKIEEDNLFEWLGKWGKKCSAFQATEQQRENLGLNLLADVFYSEEEG